MNTTAIVDLVCAVFLCVFLAKVFSKTGEHKNRWELIYCLLSIVMLVNDALAYTLTGPEYPASLKYILAFISMHGVGLIILTYTCYTESLIKEKTEIDPRFFRILKIGELIWLAASVYESLSKHMITIADGVLNIDYCFPEYIDIVELILLFAVPVYAIIIRRKIGMGMAVLFSIFAFGPIMATILFTFADIDMSYPLGAFTFLLMDLLIQEQLVREAYEKLNGAYKRIGQQQDPLQAAFNAANIESQRVRMINNIIDSSNWFYDIDGNDNVVSAQYGDVIKGKVEADSDENPMLWVELVHPEDRARVLAGFMAAITDHSGKTPYDEIFRIIDKEGKYRWSRSVGEVLRRDDGTGEYVGMSMDMTRQMEEQQKRLLGAMPLSNDVLAKANIGMWAFELDEGQPPRMYDDETMLGLVGLDHQVPPEEAYHAWYDHIDAGSYDLVTDAVNKMISGEHAEVQYPWHYPDGRTIIVRCGGIRNYAYTKGIRIEGTHQDVTQTLHFDEEQRKREEQQRNDEIARAKAEAADKAKTEFLFNMSHDIRTPMNAIIGFTDKAIKHKEDPQVLDESLEKVKSSSEYLLRIVNDILEMAKIESGKLEINEHLHFGDRGGSPLIDVLGAEAARKGIEFHTEYDVQDRYFWVDEIRANQIVANIISNAIKYTETGGSIWYRVKQLPSGKPGYGKYTVSVEDTGCGMSPEFLEKVFDAFERDASAIRSGAQGTGLGMAIVKKLLDAMGGTIDISSELGKGTTVSFTMEHRLATPEEIRASETSKMDTTAVSGDFAGKTVLLVEDNELNREIAVDILEEEGFVIEIAEDGTLAVQALKEKGPDYYDFVLMDIQMPEMNGYDATRAIRAMYPDSKLPIIALSANAFDEDKQKSFDAGMNDHVAKPINIKELFSVLTKYL